ncbi:MAG: metallophosphoesterase [Clostridia bacterium]|nr:metallophosphoesterase [Clostridia bacterium]
MVPALIVIVILLLAYLLFFLENRRFVIRRETIRHSKVTEPFTVVQVSDLHDCRFGNDQTKLLAAIRSAEPDLILITGDLFNRHNKHVYKNAFAFVRGALKIAPVWFAEGNHECALGETGEKYIDAIREMGVHILRDEYADLNEVRLIGLSQYASPETLSAMLDHQRLNLVLAHRPELFPIYAGTDADVILSGHAHGGQIRLFGIGIFAPGQGLFPKYTCGLYRRGKSLLHVSRGLGNTILVPRVFDTPELNILKFQSIESKENEHVC